MTRNINGETYTIEQHFEGSLLIGYYAQYNGHDTDFIKADNAGNEDTALSVYLGRLREAREAERSFNESHPELNP